MNVIDTLPYRSYLCLAHVCGMLSDNYQYFGSDLPFNDAFEFNRNLTELFGTDIDSVFTSQYVTNFEGKKSWAFTSADNRDGLLGARLYLDKQQGNYYLVHPPTRPSSQGDNATNVQATSGNGMPLKFQQAAALLDLVRPEFRSKVIVTGHSLGGGLAAYSALRVSSVGANRWQPRTIAFDPLGLNSAMLSGCSDSGFSELNGFVDWYYISGSWVAALNFEKGFSSVGKVWELAQDPLRAAQGCDPHDLENVRYGLRHRPCAK